MLGRWKAISIRLKILAIVLGFFTLIAAAFAVYSVITTANYRQLRTDEVSGIVAFESERVGKVIAEMERNAVDLALAGRQFYLSGERPAELGVSVSVENFSAFPAAVGGGIWYEPYALDAHTRRVCYYAFYDPDTGAVHHDPDFETEEYDYHTQMWYTTISAGLEAEYGVVWTPPYIDDAGTNALMTTVGAGIYDGDGRLAGISTVDWEIQSMVDRLSAIKPTAGSFVLLASPKDDYIISDTQESETGIAGESLRTLPWYGELRFAGDDTVSIGGFTDNGTEYISFSRMFGNGWLFSIQIPAQEIFAEIETRNNQFTVIIAGSFLTLLVLTAYLLSLLINRPLRKLTSGVSELGGGNLDKQIEIRSRDEFGTLAAAFNKMTVDLKESIEQNARERAEKERIGAELNVATQIQASMLPCI
ncbi:MAG: HAMP domain-containing protein, partial [Oscillospiraceae bacterium]|nr:HAMP domain-containing protein [Oscillospiraceae bacterium]